MAQGRVLVVPLAAFVLAVFAAAGAALFMSARSAHAEIDGACEATIAGVSVSGVDSGNRSDDIEVSQDESVIVGAVSPVGFQSHKIQLEFAGRRWTVSDEDDDGSNSWSGTVDVDDYATWGVGLYKVIGVSTLSDGSTCEGAATVDVGGNPLTTVAGAGAAAAAALGTVGTVASAAAAATRNPGPLREFGPLGDMVGEAWESQQAAEGARTRRRQAEEVVADFVDPPFLSIASLIFGCICFAGVALIMTPLMALTGGGAGGASEEPGQSSGGSAPSEPSQPAVGTGPSRLPRVPWLPRITLLGLASGLLAGAGAVVLMQQYAIEYPTFAVVLRTVLVAMAVYGVVLPTIGYTLSWMRVNARIGKLEQEIQ